MHGHERVGSCQYRRTMNRGSPLSRVLMPVLAVAVGIGGFLLIRALSGNALKLQTHVLDGRAEGPSHVRVDWEIRNKGTNAAHYRQCTISVTARNGTIVGTTSGGPFPDQVTVGPIWSGTTWHGSTIVTTSQGSASASGAEVVCTGVVNDSHGGK
jgi:hypothetical protein